METSEVTRISNSGNARAQFRWYSQGSENKLFFIAPKDGFVEPNGFVDCTVSYVPNQLSTSGKADEDKLILKVLIDILIYI